MDIIMAFMSILLLLCAFTLSNAVGRLRTFNISEDRINIINALEFCQSKYTHLATVYDKKDNTIVFDLVKSQPPKTAWIGANTNNTNYTSKWSNGDDVTFTQFTGTCNETCGAVMRVNGSWELLPYSTKIYFMCYDEGVGQVSDKYILIPLNKTWFEAQEYCRENHTDLVSIRNERENSNLVNDSVCPFWIGLLYDNFEWIDGGQSAYRNYPTGQGDWTIIYFNKWGKRGYTNTFYALCYKSFIHVSSDQMSWKKALDYCNRNASELLRIESENDQIETERELRRQKISGPVWIGLRQSRLFGFWIWVNGLQVGPWTNWKGGRQPEHQMSQYCGAIEKLNIAFKWSDRDCRSKFRVLCEGK